jgi:hypothetical protein
MTTTGAAPSGDDYYASTRGDGWLLFAGTILGLAGFMRIFDAIWAFGAHANTQNLTDGLLGDDIKNYAWLWLVVGIILILSSVAVLMRSQLARWIGMIAAGIGALSAITWMPYYPVWSFVYIALAIMVLYALAVYGGRTD